MRFSLSSFARHASLSSPTFLGVVLLVCSAVTTKEIPPAHLLSIKSISWAVVWLYSILKSVRAPFGGENRARRKRCWGAGSLLVLAHICQRANAEREVNWWTKAFLPFAVYMIRYLDTTAATRSSVLDSGDDGAPPKGSRRLLAVITLSSFFILSQPFVTSPQVALGLCNLTLISHAYILLEDAFVSAQDDKLAGNGSFVSANGTISRRSSTASAESNAFVHCLRDMSSVVALGCGAATILFESFRLDGLSFWPELGEVTGRDWKVGQWQYHFGLGIALAAMGCIEIVLGLVVIQRQGAFRLAFIELGSSISARLITSANLMRAWFTPLTAAASYLFLHDISSSSHATSGAISKRKSKQIVWLWALASFGTLAVHILRQPEYLTMVRSSSSTLINGRFPPKESKNLALLSGKNHPIHHLISNSEQRFANITAAQSKTLAQAVAEYRRRYKIPPPPNFDKWFQFAKNKEVQLIDEYDSIYHSLLPFWALQPSTIRARAREALGFNNALIGLLIRDGQAVKIEGGQEWQQQATVGMMKDFVRYLPDMDIAFNIHDEPRVVVPHEDLTRMVAIAKDVAMPAALSNKAPKNSFSKRPKDLNDGKKIEEVKTTRFNKFAHQPTWTHSRVSCSPDSPARALDERTSDNFTSYAAGKLGFVYNQTAFSDICMSPSLRETYGFFDRPNAFDIVHDLFPIFSQSKISSFQDIIYPSPWYWFGKVTYEEEKDFEWEEKNNTMYWRGSTTGGFSRAGGWRRQHRQHIVQKVNALDDAMVMQNEGSKAEPDWHVKEVKRENYKKIFDVKFSHVGQCDPEDCDAQKEFFEVVKPAGQQDAWGSKYLLDMDGNAFSGRFYAFLKSKSLVYKMAIFKEWHQEWLRPWVHYIPLSLRGDEWVENVRYFVEESEGKSQAQRMAMQGRDWANKVLRNEDFEVWFFRLLLE
ncbi:MAG: hypothetical protein M1819_000921 [Sarea resinae]|nr:MAG: hypothetical protein M1819_000921 [Sarea resinae]